MKRHVYLLISVSCLSFGSMLAQADILPSETDLSSHTHNTHLVSQAKLLSLSNFANAKRLLVNSPDGSAATLSLQRGIDTEARLASVCFITDAGNCGGAGGGTDSSSSSGAGPIDPDTDNMCKLEGYVNTVCNSTQDKGTLCPYDNGWHTGCKCKPEYNKACNGTDEQGKGSACNGKYKECCKKCTGYNYTASNIPAGHVKNGSCESCTGTKYKTKCDTNSSNTGTYVDCGSATGSGTSCKDDSGTYYTKCTCPTMYEWSTSAKKCVCSTGYKYTCSGTGYSGGEGNSCDSKYQKCKCATGYTWNASTGTCVCGSTYKYTCSGSNITGGSGTACGGKYTACKCATGFTWNSSSGMCVCNGTDWCTLNQDCSSLGYKKQTCSERTIKCPFDTSYVYCISCQSEYQYTCSGTGYSGGSGSACGGKYTQCKCATNYVWKNGSCQQLNGAQGDLYYCNGTVVGVKATDMNFYVAMKDLERMNSDSANSQCQSYVFCGNAKGKLPTSSQLLTISNNKSTINSLLTANGGTELTEDAWYWSSTDGYRGPIGVQMNGTNTWLNESNRLLVRPILASY